MTTQRLLLISGSLRNGSTNTALLNTARLVAPAGVEVVVFSGLADLPHFNPDDDIEPLPPAVAELRRQIAAADAVVFSTPEYAGALPGSFKNLLDWSVGGGEIYQKPVAYINTSGSLTAAANAHQSLRIVLGYVGAVLLEQAHIPVPRAAIGTDGTVTDLEIIEQLRKVLETLAAALGSD
ncbi:MAG: hypothetical protein QOK39_490 [Acidimicrobiaceae bacterium]|jgi:NAD(P)H-dependent FMN reductase|nr:hypothetical protein [Acidimicrobiaceae bacterium]